MTKKDCFREFIEGLPQLNGFEGDPDAKAVDEALAVWIVKYYSKGFEFDYNRRNLIIAMIKKSAKMIDMITASPLRPYIDALINMLWLRAGKEEGEKSKKTGKKPNYNAVLLGFAREVFVLGYSLRSLEKKRSKKKNQEEQ